MFRRSQTIAILCIGALFLVLLTACSAPTVSKPGARLGNALVNAQQTATLQTSSGLSLTVQPYPTPFTVYEVGQSLNHVVATGADDLGPGDPIAATINWGDNTAPTQYTFIDGRDFQIAGAHAYSKVGKYTITVTAAITAFQESVTGTGVINAVPAYTLTVKNTNTKAVSGTVATGTDPFPNDTLSGTINWGDNTPATSIQVVSSAQGFYRINSTHTYTQVGSFTITVSLNSIIVGPIQGTGTATVPGAFTLRVNNITAKAGRPFTVLIATVKGTVSAGGLRVIIEWGDNTDSKLNLSGGSGTISIQGSHSYSQAGTYTIIVIVKDNGTNEQAHASSTATVMG